MPKLIQNNEFISGSPIMDATPQPNSTHAVQSGGVYTAFNNLSTEISAINSNLSQLKYGGKNLYRDVVMLSLYVKNDGSLAADNNVTTFLANVNPNTTYTVSKTGGDRNVYALYTDYPTSGATGRIVQSTFTPNANEKYLVAYVNATKVSTIKLQLELGNTATDYEEPYAGNIELTNKLGQLTDVIIATTPQPIPNGLSAIKIPSGTRVGTVEMPNNMRGVAMRDGAVVIAFFSDYNAVNKYVATSQDAFTWHFCVVM